MKTPPDRIELMQTFVRIVEAGSLSAAALQMGATQPTVSRRLQALERSLGLRLLQRSTHAMKLTEEGQRCFARAKELLGNWHAFEADLRGATDVPEGMLRVVVPHAIGQQELVGPLAEYLRRYPRVAVEWLLHDRTPEFIAGGIDCAIHVGAVDDPSVVAVKIAEVPRIVVAAPAVLGDAPLPGHPSELAGLPWLALRTFYRNDITLVHAQGEQHRLPIQPMRSSAFPAWQSDGNVTSPQMPSWSRSLRRSWVFAAPGGRELSASMVIPANSPSRSGFGRGRSNDSPSM